MDASPHTNGTALSGPPHPIRGSKMSMLLREFIRESGPGVTFDQADDWTREHCQVGLARATFEKHYADIFQTGLSFTGAEDLDKPVVDPFAVIDQNMLTLTRFAAAVSAVGGVSKARKLLDLIEQMARSL